MAAIADAEAPPPAASGEASIAASSSDAVHSVQVDQGARAAGKLPPVPSHVKPTTSGCLPDWKMNTFMARSLACPPGDRSVTAPARLREAARRRAYEMPFPCGTAAPGPGSSAGPGSLQPERGRHARCQCLHLPDAA